MSKILFVAHRDQVLLNFAMPIARAMSADGYEVVLACPSGESKRDLQKSGFRVVPWNLKRSSLNPFRELVSLHDIRRIYREERPDLVHHFTIKPAIYGALALSLKLPKLDKGYRPIVVSHFTGLGFVFSAAWTARLLRSFLLPIMKHAFATSGSWHLFENPGDAATFCKLGLTGPERTKVISSTGIDPMRFHPPETPPANQPPLVLLASRVLWDKGVGEYVEAARLLRGKVAARFLLAGTPDPANPATVATSQIEEWQKQGLVQWLGHCSDMASLLRTVDVAVLPSYHEGAPRFLLEAAASAVPVVATDIPGCRVMVVPDQTGILVPVKNAHALAEAIEKLLLDPALRMRMGAAGREMVLERFSPERVLSQYRNFYSNIGL